MQLSLAQILKFFTVMLIAVSCLFSCATKDKDLNTAEGLFAYAKEFEKAERYEVALQKYGEVRNKYPYNSLATEAELAMADVQYLRESYPEAEVAYQNFRDLHPKHAKSDYVLYRIGMSYYMQLPETIDRDLSQGKDAMYHFSELLKLYPKSGFVADARTKRDEVLSKMAEKQLYIADFYFKEESYAAALRRYEESLQKYPNLGFDPRAHLGAARSANKLNDFAKRDLHTKTLSEQFPDSSETKSLHTEGM